jgi:Tfp pilus assembly protein PilF
VVVTVSNAYFAPPGRVVLVPPPVVLVPYGIFEPRFEVPVLTPVYVVPASRLAVPALDLSGVDLDVVPPPWAKDQELPRRGMPAVLQPKLEEVAKRIEPPKKEVPPPELPKPPEPFQAKLNPAEEGKRLATLGMLAFQEAEYGLAAQRFQQALDADPATARPHFLLGQAYLALGRFREAVQTIGVGLAKDPTWPKSDFRPRLNLYLNQPGDWTRHIDQLDRAQQKQPQNAGYLFLLAYVRWFDDDRVVALQLFREVRPLVADPALVDLFLKAAP